MKSRHVHIFPVDDSFGTDMLAAWVEICNFGKRVTYTGGERWAQLTCDGEECFRIEEHPDLQVKEIRGS